MNTLDAFRTEEYRKHNLARMAHAETVLDFRGKTVLEVGAGIGDHTEFLLSRGAKVHATDGRQGCVDAIRNRFGDKVEVSQFNVDDVTEQRAFVNTKRSYDIGYCYGLLYHTWIPHEVVKTLSGACRTLIVETQVLPNQGIQVEFGSRLENSDDPTQGIQRCTSTFTRRWLWHELRKYYTFVYTTNDQPNHPEFPLDWDAPNDGVNRAVFVGSELPMGEFDKDLIPYLTPAHRGRTK